MEGRVDIFDLTGDLTVLNYALVVPVGAHVTQVGANDSLVVNIAIVIQRLINDTATLRENAVRMCVTAIVVDGVQNVVFQVVRARRHHATMRTAAGECARGGIDDFADILAECCEHWVQVEGV